MNLYYQNETLYVDVETFLTREDIEFLKNKLFHIIENYDIDQIIINNKTKQLINRYYLNKIRQEYNNRYQGRMSIK